MTELKAPIVLKEYETSTERLTDREAGDIGISVDDVLEIKRNREKSGHWDLRPQHYVGALMVGDRPILIHPKIPLENVFTLLEVGLPEHAWRREVFPYGRTPNLLTAVVAWFARLVESTLARGLLHNYQRRAERLVAMRGRIDINGLFKQPGLSIPVPCRFDEFTTDITENRYLRTALGRASRVPDLTHDVRLCLRRELIRLEYVEDVELRPEAFDEIVFTRLNEHYKSALRLARLLLENLTLIDRAGEVAAASFLVDMNKVFEDFVTHRLKRLLWDRLDVQSQAPTHLDTGGRVNMKPDLVFKINGDTRYVADVKYKLIEGTKAQAPDYYQLLAYTTALNLPEGVLIYCCDKDHPKKGPVGPVEVRHAGKQLHTYALDLSGKPSDIDTELRNLATWIRKRSAPASTK